MAEKSLAHLLKNFLLIYILPSEAVAETFTIILSAFISVLAFLRNIAVSDSQSDLTNATLFQQPGIAEDYAYVDDNFSEFEPNYTIAVSNAVLWVCREGSTHANFYRTFYTGAIVFLIFFHLLTAFSRFFTPKFWHIYKLSSKSTSSQTVINIERKNLKMAVKTIIGAIFFNLAFLMLLLSFDISPWSCLQRPSTISVDYSPVTNQFVIQIDHDPGAIRFQQGAAIVSALLICVWVVVHVVFLVHDYNKGELDNAVDQYDSPIQLSTFTSAHQDKDDSDDNS